MSFKLPTQVDIGGQTVLIKTVANMSKCGAHGLARYDDGEIWIDADLKPLDLKAISYYHELIHMILNSIGRSQLRDDEGFVDSFANHLWQAEKTKRYT